MFWLVVSWSISERFYSTFYIVNLKKLITMYSNVCFRRFLFFYFFISNNFLRFIQCGEYYFLFMLQRFESKLGIETPYTRPYFCC